MVRGLTPNRADASEMETRTGDSSAGVPEGVGVVWFMEETITYILSFV
jgi:hypothetical protein